VRDLIRRDQERAAKLAEHQELIGAGIKSGVSGRPMDGILEAARQQATKRAHEL
jgi:antitoxin ParD1/3/4